MITRCPVCGGVYLLHAGVAASHGAVFCTHCKCVFDALRTLTIPTPESESTMTRLASREIGDRVLLHTGGIPRAEPYREVSQEVFTLPDRPRPATDATGSPITRGSVVAALSGILSAMSLALRNMIRNRRRSAFALSAISFGVIALLLAGGFIEWVLDAMRESTIQSQLGHLQIARKGYFEGGQVDPFAYILPLGSPEFDEVSALKEVKVVTPRVYFSGLLSRDETTVSFLGQGIDPERERDLSEGLEILAGKGLRGDEKSGVILGSGLAKNVGASVGDKVVLLANTESGSINAVELQVQGIFVTSVKAFDDAALRIHIDSARQLVKAAGSHVWMVLLTRTESTPEALRQTRALLGDGEFEIKAWFELADFFNKTVKLFQRQVTIVSVIIGLLILLSISNTMMMNVMERTSEIGTLMAIGLKRTKVRTLFLWEGVMLGAIGGLLGLCIGTALALIVSAIGIPMPPPPGMAVGFTGRIMVTPSLMLMSFMVAFLAACAATIYPAVKASRLNIVDALRHGR